MHADSENNNSYWKSINSPFWEYLIWSKTIGAFYQNQISFLVKNLGKSYQKWQRLRNDSSNRRFNIKNERTSSYDAFFVKKEKRNSTEIFNNRNRLFFSRLFLDRRLIFSIAFRDYLTVYFHTASSNSLFILHTNVRVFVSSKNINFPLGNIFIVSSHFNSRDLLTYSLLLFFFSLNFCFFFLVTFRQNDVFKYVD